MTITTITKSCVGLALLATLTACSGMSTRTDIVGDRVKAEVHRSPGGLSGDDLMVGVADFQDHSGAWMTRDILVTSTSFGKMLLPQLIAGAAVASIQAAVGKYQVDNQCDTACGDVTNILANSQSENITQVQVDAIAKVLQNSGKRGW